ncbi:hypothetical protein AMJ71_10500 [candidate division TA06 bacterium SM1_40]|uniref:VOC domain-containing protein n=1 Tax=candidate division TA06 bacterium SM1_40 TaxID=1703773 RepID=A0A0S8JBD0_UNCT6|nr:MAG: hypothetical protein AMJ71_10500 [candidate division TA06 bacterium SM1_40]
MKSHMWSILAVLVCVGLAWTIRAEEGDVPVEEGGEMPTNPIVFWEIASHDAEKSVDFLREVFDWNIEFDERVGFYIVSTGQPASGLAGGVFTLKKARLPFLTIYIHVDDIDSKVKQIEKFGGHIVEPPSEIPGGSRICLFNEPSGVTLAMIERAAGN